MDIGGKKDDKDNRKKRKGKEKVEKDLDEEELPRNKKYMEKEKNSHKKTKVADDGYDVPPEWDWRDYRGIISNVLDQGDHLICWAIAFIRAIEALFNIGKRLENQRSFSIQHLVNNITIGVRGLKTTSSIGQFVAENGVYEEGECSYRRSKQTCAHVDPKTERIDRFVIIDNVDDVELARLVWKHPVVGVVPLWGDLNLYRQGIYKPPKSSEGRTYNFYHAVLIVGFGVDEHGNHFWIIQNSAGTTWGEGGFGRLHRERGGRKSLFFQVYYGEKKGYPEKDNK